MVFFFGVVQKTNNTHDNIASIKKNQQQTWMSITIFYEKIQT